ncbi:MAG: GFA family protein [Alphaproteobacteria bacterium]|nr:GFA family protein [Alphaproteobacteria bacterium]
MKIDGSCHCGYITYGAEIDPDKVVICHCTDCQSLSGSAFRTVAMSRAGTFALRSGTPKLYVKTAESGAGREQAFCPECGSPIYSTSVGDGPKIHGIRVGTIRQRNELIPTRQVWTRSEQHWVDDLGSVPKVAKQSQLALKPTTTD